MADVNLRSPASDLRDAIRSDSAARNRLHDQLIGRVATRDRSPPDRAAWHSAADAFRAYVSDIDPLLDACLERGLADPALRRFAFIYLEEDPRYFRSGYLTEKLIRRVKKLDLDENERDILRAMVLRRIDQGRRRDFRHVCRVIPRIETDAFRHQVIERLSSPEPAIRRWAGFAASYFKVPIT